MIMRSDSIQSPHHQNQRENEHHIHVEFYSMFDICYLLAHF